MEALWTGPFSKRRTFLVTWVISAGRLSARRGKVGHELLRGGFGDGESLRWGENPLKEGLLVRIEEPSRKIEIAHDHSREEGS